VALLGVAEDRALAPLGEVAALALQPFGIDVVNALVRIQRTRVDKAAVALVATELNPSRQCGSSCAD
jgi:hypothetical protein